MINFGGIFNIDAAGCRGWQVYVGKAQTLYFHLKITLRSLNFAERRYLLLETEAATSIIEGAYPFLIHKENISQKILMVRHNRKGAEM